MQSDAEDGTGGHARTLKRVTETTRSWRSAEDGISTLLECFDSIVAALDKLHAESHDSSTTSSANGLLFKLQSARCIMTVIFLQRILRMTGPVSRILQSTSADLSVTATLIDGCIKQLAQLRDDVDDFFAEVKSETADFCAKHNVDPQLKSVRSRKVRRMPGEQAPDECVSAVETAFKTDVVIRGLDVVLLQFRDRFSQENMELLHEMKYFTPSSLLSSTVITAKDIEHICEFYNFDPDVVARERNDFLAVYQSMSPLIDTSDLCRKPRAGWKQTELKNDSVISVTENDGNGQVATVSEESTEQQQQRQSHDSWVNRTFVKPMRALEELSSFTSLSSLMKMLATVAVTSCSAERAMSRVKIIKNRLHSTMLDDWFSALTILASERDLVDGLNTDEITDRFALLSDKLQKYLSC